MLAKFCLQQADFRGAVEFLLMANQMDASFDIAQAGTDEGGGALLCRWQNPHPSVRTCSYNETFEYEWSSYCLISAATKETSAQGKREMDTFAGLVSS
jgi:hypothetical protein